MSDISIHDREFHDAPVLNGDRSKLNYVFSFSEVHIPISIVVDPIFGCFRMVTKGLKSQIWNLHCVSVIVIWTYGV